MAGRREDWERMRAEGRTRYLLRHGILVRGLPMALLTVGLIQAVDGDLGTATLASPQFHERLFLALVLFGLGGVASAYARWRSFEARFRDEP